MFVKSVVLFVKYLVGHDQSALKDGRSTSGPEVGSCTMGFCTSEFQPTLFAPFSSPLTSQCCSYTWHLTHPRRKAMSEGNNTGSAQPLPHMAFLLRLVWRFNILSPPPGTELVLHSSLHNPPWCQVVHRLAGLSNATPV